MTNRTVNSTPVIYKVNDLNQVTSDGVNAYTYDEILKRTKKGEATVANPGRPTQG